MQAITAIGLDIAKSTPVVLAIIERARVEVGGLPVVPENSIRLDSHIPLARCLFHQPPDQRPLPDGREIEAGG